MQVARENPDVEILVRKLRRGRAAVLRGHYGGSFSVIHVVTGGEGSRFVSVNGRDKVICVNGLETNEVANKVSLSLHQSGSTG
jgi:large subunit ribosomal protein L43